MKRITAGGAFIGVHVCDPSLAVRAVEVTQTQKAVSAPPMLYFAEPRATPVTWPVKSAYQPGGWLLYGRIGITFPQKCRNSSEVARTCSGGPRFFHRQQPKAADLQNRSALRSLPIGSYNPEPQTAGSPEVGAAHRVYPVSLASVTSCRLRRPGF